MLAFMLQFDTTSSHYATAAVSTAARMKSVIFWGTTLRHWLSSSRRFEETYCIHLEMLRPPRKLKIK